MVGYFVSDICSQQDIMHIARDSFLTLSDKFFKKLIQ